MCEHGGEGLAEMANWLMATSEAYERTQIYVAMEMQHGAVVERLIERGFKVHAIDPKQMDRFRDASLWRTKGRQTRREVMRLGLANRCACFRQLDVDEPVVDRNARMVADDGRTRERNATA